MTKITRQMIERAARQIYRHAAWDTPWKNIAPEGRRRFRTAARDAIFAALPDAIMVKGKKR